MSNSFNQEEKGNKKDGNKKGIHRERGYNEKRMTENRVTPTRLTNADGQSVKSSRSKWWGVFDTVPKEG